jgi:hypothetical protein
MMFPPCGKHMKTDIYLFYLHASILIGKSNLKLNLIGDRIILVNTINLFDFERISLKNTPKSSADVNFLGSTLSKSKMSSATALCDRNLFEQALWLLNRKTSTGWSFFVNQWVCF